MTIEDFINFLQKHGVEYYIAENSIVLKYCPSCGSNKNKVWLFKERPSLHSPFFGKCMKCEQKYNSRTYLIDYGINETDVKILHGLSTELKLDLLPEINIQEITKNEFKKPEVPQPIDISEFIPITSWLEHPAAQYAIKRGFVPELGEKVLLDYLGSSVVFIVNEGNVPVGWQKRFLMPPFPDLKTMSSPGFKKLEWILDFPNNGDICVVEGPFTAVAAWHYGYHAVCTFGSIVGPEQIKKIINLAKNQDKSIAVAFDLDEAGIKGFRKVSSSVINYGIKTYRIQPEYGNDLNDSWMAGKGVKIISNKEEDITVPLIFL